MESAYLEYLQQVLYETAEELSNISLVPEDAKQFLVGEFLKIFDAHYKLINYIENDTDEIVEIKKIKKDKSYLEQYISAFKRNLKLFTIIKDEISRNKMILTIWLFDLFIEDVKEFYKTQRSIHTFFLAYPENEKNYLMLKNRKRLLKDTEKFYIIMYQRYKYLQSLLKFFRCYSLTKKNIMTSLSITLYKSLIKTNAISKYQIKEILETMFHKLDNPTIVRVDEMDRIYIKTVVDKLPIYAYPSSNGKESLYNFEEINKKLSAQLEKYQDNPSKKEKYENYIKTKISPLQDKLNQ